MTNNDAIITIADELGLTINTFGAYLTVSDEETTWWCKADDFVEAAEKLTPLPYARLDGIEYIIDYQELCDAVKAYHDEDVPADVLLAARDAFASDYDEPVASNW